MQKCSCGSDKVRESYHLAASALLSRMPVIDTPQPVSGPSQNHPTQPIAVGPRTAALGLGAAVSPEKMVRAFAERVFDIIEAKQRRLARW
jgi:hypothetical protein